MSTTTKRLPPGVAGESTANRIAVAWAVLALARVEVVRLLRHPAVLLALAAMAALWVTPRLGGATWTRFPVLHEQDRATQDLALLPGLAALVAGNLAVLRSRRDGTEELYGVLLLPRWARTGAHLLALLPLALLVGAAAAVHLAALAAAPGAVGQVNPWEVATGPALVLLLGAVGVLIGRVVPSAVAASLAVVLLLLAFDVMTSPVFGLPGRPVEWLTLVVGERLGQEGLTPDLLARPAIWHVAYLTGLALVVACGTLLRDRAPRIPLLAALFAAALGTVTAGALQLRPVSEEVRAARVAATERPSTRQTCETAGTVTYCTFAGYGAWIREWRPVVEAVRRLLPRGPAERPLVVRQRMVATNPAPEDGNSLAVPPPPLAAWRADDRAAGTPGAVAAGTAWGSGRNAFGLAGLVAHRATGATDADDVLCGGRAIVLLWLAARATPETATGFVEAMRASGGDVFFETAPYGPSVHVTERDVAVVQALLRLPTERVGDEIRADWDALTAAKVPTAKVAARFGLSAPPQPPKAERTVGTEGC